MRIISKIGVPPIFLRRLVAWVLKYAPKGEINTRNLGDLTFYPGEFRIRVRRHTLWGVIERGTEHIAAHVAVRMPKPDYAFATWFNFVSRFYVELFPSEYRSSPFGEYRTEVSKAFAQEGRDLIERWQAACPKEDPCDTQRRRVRQAQAKLKAWQRKALLAQTKLVHWKACLRRAEQALQRAEEKQNG